MSVADAAYKLLDVDDDEGDDDEGDGGVDIPICEIQVQTEKWVSNLNMGRAAASWPPAVQHTPVWGQLLGGEGVNSNTNTNTQIHKYTNTNTNTNTNTALSSSGPASGRGGSEAVLIEIQIHTLNKMKNIHMRSNTNTSWPTSVHTSWGQLLGWEEGGGVELNNNTKFKYTNTIKWKYTHTQIQTGRQRQGLRAEKGEADTFYILWNTVKWGLMLQQSGGQGF